MDSSRITIYKRRQMLAHAHTSLVSKTRSITPRLCNIGQFLGLDIKLQIVKPAIQR